MFYSPNKVMPEITAKVFEAFLQYWTKELSEKFVLVGGTALALRIAHRTSEDLDLFSVEERISPQTSDLIQAFLKKLKSEVGLSYAVKGADHRQVDYWIEGVKVSFCARGLPFLKENYEQIADLKIASMDTLIAMKGKAIQAQRTKSRDFFDVATIVHHGISPFEKVWDLMVQKYPDAPFTEGMLVKRLLDTPLDDDDEGFLTLETYNDLPTDFDGLRQFMADQIYSLTINEEEIISQVTRTKQVGHDLVEMRFGLGGNTLLQKLYMIDEEKLMLHIASTLFNDILKKNYAGETILDDLYNASNFELIVALLDTADRIDMTTLDKFKNDRKFVKPKFSEIIELWQINKIASTAQGKLSDAISSLESKDQNANFFKLK